MRTDQNERVDILEFDETSAAPTIEAALLEYQLLATHLTSAKHGLYETSLSPRHNETLTHQQWEQAVDILADQLGLSGQPRIVVLHQKNGREHVHAVFQRTDTETMRVISDSHNYPAHELAARQIEKTFDLEPSFGVFTREQDEPRPEQTFTRAEHQKAERTGISAEERKAEITELYREAKTGREFIDNLEENGYYLARGDKTNIFMVVDPQFEAHRLSTCLKGVKMSEVKALLHPLKPSNFETVETCKRRLTEQSHVLEEADKLREKHLSQMEKLTSEHQMARDRLEARHILDNQADQDSRKAPEFPGILQTIKLVFGITWMETKIGDAADRKRRAEQSQELEDLKRDQLNERTALQRTQRKEWHKLDQEHKPELDIKARFEVASVRRRENEFEEKMQALRDYDEGKDEWRFLNEKIFQETRKRDKIRFKEDYLTALEASLSDTFDLIFEDSDQALEKFKGMASETSIKKAIKALERRPAQFGHLKGDSLKNVNQQIELAAVDARKIHYLKPRIENASRNLWQTESYIRHLQTKKLEYLQSVPDEKLVLLRELQFAANKLDEGQWKELDPDAKHAIRQSRDLFKDREKRELADRLLKREIERDEQERERTLELRREIDPPI
tara:strand:+ start:452 stop:2317 length:1866 start_codon:yes stop_codon:yes gene_type:complete